MTKLKQEYGYAFTSKLEGMLKDLKTSDSLKEQWKSWQEEKLKKKKCEKLPFDLNVQVLTYGYWPSVMNSSLNLPSYIQIGCKDFNEFYYSKFEGRSLMWMYNMGSSDIRANGYSKKYDFVVSSYQMGILLTLNDNPKITFKELVEGTKIPMENLRSGLIQLINLTDTKEKNFKYFIL